MNAASAHIFCKRRETLGNYKRCNGRTRNVNAYACNFKSGESKFCHLEENKKEEDSHA